MLPLQGGIDQVAMMLPITKWSHRITHTERIPDLVAQALRIATTGRPGPVFLEIPIDVLFARAEEEQAFFPRSLAPEHAPAPPPAAVERAVEWLREAERPAIVAGGGAFFSGAAAELLSFAERTGVPVFLSNPKAHGMLPANHPLRGGALSSLAFAAMAGGAEADVVLILGARLGLFTGGRARSMIPAGARVIQVDIEGEEIGRNRDIDLGIVADCRETLRAFDEVAARTSWPARDAWHQAIRNVQAGQRSMFAGALEGEKAPIHPYRLAAAIAETLDDDAILVADGGETAVWMGLAAEVRLSHGYLGCLGTGMPFAIAAQVAHPQRRVLCIIGDGSVGLNFAEFDTMVRHELPIVTVINNDQQWGMSAHGQEVIYGKDRQVVTRLGPTRYDEAAAGFGCHTEFVVEPGDLVPALERALASGKPACVNVLTDPDVTLVTRDLVASFYGMPMDAEG
jgi:acetolactate synthase-1/2/3 large subunit